MTTKLWMFVGQVFGSLHPLAMAIALVTPLYMVIVGMMGLFTLDAKHARIAISICVVGWLITSTYVAIRATPQIAPSFGSYAHGGTFRRPSIPESIGLLLRQMRFTIILLLLGQLVAAIASLLLFENQSSYWNLSRGWSPQSIGAFAFFFLGCFTQCFGHTVFLHSRGRKIRNWLRHCSQGIALRSFLPEWDCEFREIFVDCRSSRRMGEAYRSIKMGAAGCFAASGCIAAIMVGESAPGITLVVLSMIATSTMWPTAHGIAYWTKSMMDSTAGHRTEEKRYRVGVAVQKPKPAPPEGRGNSVNLESL